MTSNPSQVDHQKIFDIVATIWMQLLGVSEIEAGDNFFRLGGDSMKAAIMMVHVFHQLSIGLDPIEIYEAPVLGDFVSLVASMSSEAQPSDVAG